MTKIDVSKVTAFAVIGPPSGAVTVTKASAFVVLAPENKRRQVVVNCTS